MGPALIGRASWDVSGMALLRPGCCGRETLPGLIELLLEDDRSRILLLPLAFKYPFSLIFNDIFL